MALVHPSSCECLHSGLDLFSVPPTQTAVEEGQFIEVHPLASLAPGAPIEFTISGSGEEYLDLFNTFLRVRAKITTGKGDNIAADAEVVPVNYFLHSLFSQVDVTLNDTLITPSENTYPFRAYLEAALSYGEEAKKGHLSAALYIEDETVRRELTENSKEVDMIGRLHCDIFAQERYLLPGVDVKIKLSAAKDTFNLITKDQAGAYKSVITHAVLVIRRAKLNPAVSLAHEKALLKGNAKYPLKRVALKTFSIPKYMVSFIQDNLFLSQTPTRLVLGVLTSAAFNGTYATDPFSFKPCGLIYLNLTIEGRSVTGKPLSMNYEQNHYVKAFHGTLLALGLVGKDAGNGIDYRRFKDGFTLYAFDLSPSLLDGDQFEMVRAGGLSIEFKFLTPTPESLQIIAYAEYDAILEISKTRQVLTD